MRKINDLNLEKSDKMRIKHIMTNFDFKKVHKVMSLIKWEWWDSDVGISIPTIIKIKKNAKSLLEETLKHGIIHKIDTSISSGGFKAEYIIENDKLHLYFIVTEWDDECIKEDIEYQKIVEKETIKKNRVKYINKVLKEK